MTAPITPEVLREEANRIESWLGRVEERIAGRQKPDPNDVCMPDARIHIAMLRLAARLADDAGISIAEL